MPSRIPGSKIFDIKTYAGAIVWLENHAHYPLAPRSPSPLTLRTMYMKSILGLAILASGADAFWRLPCSSPVVVERADPIVDPNAVSKHVHTVLGANAFNFTMNYEDTQTASCSTCKAVEDLSNYWVPNLYYHAQNGSFIPVRQTGGALIYYLQRFDPKDPNAAEGLIAFPKDFRMLAGNPTNRNFTNTPEQRAVSFVCLGTEGPATYNMPNKNCPGGLRAQLIMPSCWDGRNLDSPDHKSHMAYPSGLDNGVCPSSHPKRFITLFYEVNWSVDDFKNMWYGNEQPFVFSNGDPTGYGYHGDFVNGWDIPTLQRAINECNAASGNIEECGAFTLRRDEDMNACKVLPRVHEAVGGAALAALPGCNAIQRGPAPATAQTGCGAPAAIGDPILPYTDASATRGWAHVACAKDPQGQRRTLADYALDRGDMTVARCLDACGARGYKFAGVEYRSQCFCGNALSPDRLPTPGTLGDCSLPCAGDPAQLCGGAAQVSVYERCADPARCVNYDGDYH
ncbi:putative WSC domain-containing protein [Rosellinia necatrix]|uniref:Putative WSC domain-containing protein n=1 Tax=Rosellinia necatrix TaxID=77044 RepID=A0A1S7UJ24_ROSNE|nr:putative WSC domain-containing protein [Rosellinia necatrix]